MPTKPKRLGLFGGTFNPIHYGHLRAAEEVCEVLGLHRLWFIPAAVPPHKAHEDLQPFSVRLEMTKLAVGRHPRFSVSDIEGRRPEKSYSIETLKILRQELGPSWELYFILGLDAILEIQTWKDYRDLFTLCHFAVLDRPGYEHSHLEVVLRREVHPDFEPLEDETGFRHPLGFKTLLLPTTRLDISATRIRRLAARGGSLRYLLPEAVRRYILRNKLYHTAV